MWLPAYRLLLLLEEFTLGLDLNKQALPFLLQLSYVGLIWYWIIKKARSSASPMLVTVLLLWPLPILFGGFNMSEGLSLVTVSATFLLVKNKPTVLRVCLSVFFCSISALTRHEATALLGIYAIVLFLMRYRTSSYAVVSGLSIGIVVLSLWNWVLIDDPFFWLTSKFNASSSGAAEIIETRGILPRVLEALFAILLVFPSFPW